MSAGQTSGQDRARASQSSDAKDSSQAPRASEMGGTGKRSLPVNPSGNELGATNLGAKEIGATNLGATGSSLPVNPAGDSSVAKTSDGPILGATGKRSLPVNATANSASSTNSASSPPDTTSLLSTIIRLAIGLLLLTSAAFKVHAIFTEPYFADSILGSPLWMVGLVECEVLLGLWLISGVALRIAWHVALAAFVGFAGINVYLLATGATTCGCFGTVETHPWVMLGLDLAVLAALVIWRPKRQATTASTEPTSGVFKHIAIVGGLSAVMLGIAAAWLVVSYGSLDAGINALRGEVVSISPSNIDAGEAPAGTKRIVTAQIHNSSDKAVRVIGGSASCKCVVTGNLPVEIPPRSSVTLEVSIRFKGEPGPFREHFSVFADSENALPVLGRIHGWVVDPQDATLSRR